MYWPPNALPQRKPKTMLIDVSGKLAEGVTAKDLALGIIGQIGTDGATGHVIEYAGEAVRALSDGRPHDALQHEHRGRSPRRHGRAGRNHVCLHQGPPFRSDGANWDEAVARWRSLASDPGAHYDKVIEIDAVEACAICHLGNKSRHGGSGSGQCAGVERIEDDADRRCAERMLEYMGLEPGTRDGRYSR